MRIFILLLVMAFTLVACGGGTSDSPTADASSSSATSTLIPTQANTLAPTEEDGTKVFTSQGDNQPIVVAKATNTPQSCSSFQTNWKVYTVVRGDSLVNIASAHNSTVEELATANCLDNPNSLRIGQIIYVPNSAQPDFSVSVEKTYKSELGFELKYPAEWFMSQLPASSVEGAVFTSFEYTLGDEIPQSEWKSNMVSVTISISKDPSSQSLNQWTQESLQQFQSAANISEVKAPQRITLGSGLAGISIDYIAEDGKTIRNYYFIVNERNLNVSVGGNFDLADKLINSVRGV